MNKWIIKYDENNNPLYLENTEDKTFKRVYFIDEEELKNKKYNLYLYCEVINGQLYLKFGKAHASSVYDRYQSTGHLANKKMICLWEEDKDDTPIHNIMIKHCENGLHFTHAPFEVLNTEEAYLIEDSIGYSNFINALNEEIGKTGVSPKKHCDIYKDIIELVKLIETSVKEKGVLRSTKFILDLCARWGKTNTNLLIMEMLPKTRVHLMCSYVGTVRTSYRDNIEKYTNFDNILYVDPDNYEDKKEMISKITDWLDSDKNHQVFFYLALTGTFNGDSETFESIDDSTFTRRISGIEVLKHYGASMFVEEGDFGSSCEKQVKKLRKLYKDMKCKYFFSTTGTNAEKTESIFKCDKYIKRDYIYDVLGNPNSGRDNVVKIHWSVLNNSVYSELGFADNCNFENFTDIFTIKDGEFRGKAYLKSLITFFFDRENFRASDNRSITALRKLKNKKFFDDEASTIIFTPAGYEIHSKLKELIKSVVNDKYIIKVIDGKKTTNAGAEEYAKLAIADAELQKKQVIFIASGMANRSFSIQEIKNVILLVNDISYASLQQKDARSFTPWDKKHDTAYIIDFRLNYTSVDRSSCLSKYISAMACDELSDKDSTEVINIPKLLKEASDKITFDELFYSGEEPIRELSEKELDDMMHTASFNTKRVYLIKDKINQLRNPKRCGLNEEPSKLLKNTNIKGDSNKFSRTSSKSMTETRKEELKEQDSKMQHALFIMNNPNYFNTNTYSEDIWDNEMADIFNSKRKDYYEETFDLDMDLIRDLVNLFLKEKIIGDFSF